MYVLTNEDHRMDFYSRTAGQRLTLFYRSPTEDERFGYENGKIKRVKGQAQNNIGRIRRTYGLAIVTGLGKGCFGKPVNGKVAPISSDPDSVDYDPDWKKVLRKNAPELLAELAKAVFEEPVVAIPPQDPTDEADTEDFDDEDRPAAEDAAGN